MFKRTSVLMMLAMVLALVPVSRSLAVTYTFQPSPKDMHDLDHEKYYTWGIGWSIPTDHRIVSASLFFDNIANWDNNPNVLYVHLLDTNFVGLNKATDNEGGGDKFAGQGIKLFQWNNLTTTPSDRTYEFSALDITTLSSYAANGRFGFGLDPDCHYYNDGVTFTVQTAPIPHEPPTPAVPEPVTILSTMLSLGAVTMAGMRRRRVA